MNWLPNDFNPKKDKIAYYGNTFVFTDRHARLLEEFRKRNPEIKNIPYDWTIYYLRKIGLTEKLTPQELTWIVMQFNQKRGYYELRGDESADENIPDNKEFIDAEIKEIIDTGEKNKNLKILEIHLDNGMSGTINLKEIPDWKGTRKELILTSRKLKSGEEKHTFTFPDENDWTLRKKKTEHVIASQKKHVGTYILDTLLEYPNAKIRGKEVHTIDREYYKNELSDILETQKKYHPELSNTELLRDCVLGLYPNNIVHQRKLLGKDLNYLLVHDILFYQRPLKSKKSQIDTCKFEKRFYMKDGEKIEAKVHAIPKSHPLFQEFRTWQFIHNLRILEREKTVESKSYLDFDVTDEVINAEIKERLFEFLKLRKDISQKQLLKFFNLNEKYFKWNFDEDKTIDCNTTIALCISKLKSVNKSPDVSSLLIHLNDVWHLLYSVPEKKGVKNGLKKLGFTEEEATSLSTIPKFKNDYSNYSYKAINKLLSVMRCGSNWNADNIDSNTKQRIQKLIDGEVDENISERTRELLAGKTQFEDFQGLNLTLAEYVVYGRHSERETEEKINNVNDVPQIQQHSLRNPVVEQITNETLSLVKDIWKKYGDANNPYFDEIHIELSRDIKKTKKEREKQNKRISDDEQWNRRVHAILSELKNDPEIEGHINPESPAHIEIFKLWESARDQNKAEAHEEIKSMFKKPLEPTISEINRYKLWADQKHLSPYTGKPIPISRLFTREYDIEHIFPKSRYFDDSFNNKVIAERGVNEKKGNQTGLEFILNHGGEIVRLGHGKEVKILEKENYEQLVKRLFFNNRAKLKNLLREEIPDSFISRQLNDTRYISRKTTELLAPLAKDKLVLTNGTITTKLKNEWGLNDVMKSLVWGRFERMNTITGSSEWLYKENDTKWILNGYSKRIDHRHHALDALVVACTTQSHIQYLNTLNAQYKDPAKREKFRHLVFIKSNKFKLPWDSFVPDTKNQLEKTIISFKNTNRILNRGNNTYQKFTTDGSAEKKVLQKQTSPDLWSVRQPLHKETVYGKIKMRDYKKNVAIQNTVNQIDLIADKKVKKAIKGQLIACNGDIKELKKKLKKHPLEINGQQITKTDLIEYKDVSVARKPLDTKFTHGTLDKVVRNDLKQQLKMHLDNYDGNPEQAFSEQGLIVLDKKLHHPVRSIRLYEDLGKKFQLGTNHGKDKKYVETAKGTNLFFLIYENTETGERIINDSSSLVLKDVIELKKSNLPLAEKKEGYHWFVLSPGDLVYMPDENEDVAGINWQELTKEQVNNIYKMVSCTGGVCYFLPNHSAETIAPKIEFGSNNKTERSIKDGRMIKQHCIKLQCDRLGNAQPAKFETS